MNNFLNLSKTEQIKRLNEAVFLLNLPPEAIEKDVWVTAVLRSLFALPYANQISFKGGTSLSKCWNVIERFSEDVDVAINREYFGFTGETLSKREVNKKLRKAACAFCRGTLQFDLVKQMIADGIPETQFSVTMEITDSTTTDPEEIFINYKSLFSYNQNNNAKNYIKPVVVLEVNGRSMKEPLESVEIKSFVDEVFADRAFADKPFPVATVVPERTFDYNTLLPQFINIIPPESVIDKWADDYTKMQTMIYGDNTLTFTALIDKIKQLNNRINQIVW